MRNRRASVRDLEASLHLLSFTSDFCRSSISNGLNPKTFHGSASKARKEEEELAKSKGAMRRRKKRSTTW